LNVSTLVQTNLSTIGAILSMMAGIALLETALPLHAPGRWHRAHRRPNLGLTLITFASNVFLNGALLLLLAALERSGLGVLRWFSLGPIPAGVIAVVALDFSFYLAHVAMHKVPAFWKVHRVHHSDPVVDVTTTIRQHPLEGLIRYAFMTACAAALGVGLIPFTVYRTWSALAGLLEHANLRVPSGLDGALSLVATWPNLHKVHHSRDARETDTNYGNIFPWFDWLFSTYTPSSRGATVACGLDGFDDPDLQSTAGLLAMPFRDAPASDARLRSAMATSRRRLLAPTLALLSVAGVAAAGAPPGAAELERGVRLARRGAVSEALALFERAARRRPDLPEPHLNRGLMLAQSGRHAEAQAALRQALALDPEMPQALEGLALSLLLEQRNGEALAAYRRAMLQGASSADTHYNLAIALARLGELERAAQACRDAIRLRPGMAQAHALLEELER